MEKKIIYKELKEIKPYENNPRNNEGAVEGVKKSIEKFGFQSPIILDKDNVIIAGHTRYLASKELKLEKVPCIVADELTEEQVKALRLVDNKVAEGSFWDYNLLDFELDAIKDINMEEFGFLDNESMSLLDDMVDSKDFKENDDTGMFQMTFLFKQESKDAINKYIKKYGKEAISAEIEKICQSD